MRKQPQQRRSREMVERLLAAGRQVLAEEGYDAFSTNRVAARAGVSPGSLYQYFPDKAAVLDAIIDRYWDQIADQVAAALVDRLGDAGPEMVRETAEALLSALEENAPLVRVIVAELPQARHHARRVALERRVCDLATAYLVGRGLRDTTIAGTRAWVVVLVAEHLATRFVLDRPGIGREELLDEMVRLVGGYVGLPGPAHGPD